MESGCGSGWGADGSKKRASLERFVLFMNANMHKKIEVKAIALRGSSMNRHNSLRNGHSQHPFSSICFHIHFHFLFGHEKLLKHKKRSYETHSSIFVVVVVVLYSLYRLGRIDLITPTGNLPFANWLKYSLSILIVERKYISFYPKAVIYIYISLLDICIHTSYNFMIWYVLLCFFFFCLLNWCLFTNIRVITIIYITHVYDLKCWK